MRARTGAALVALLIVWPSALAASDLAAARIDVLGDARLSSDLQAVFVVIGTDPPTWHATATSAIVQRHYIDGYSAGGILTYSPPTEEWKTETVTLSDTILQAEAAREGGALLVRGDAAVLASSPSGMVLATAIDPRLDQGPPPDVETGDGDPMEIHEVLSGQFLATRLEEGVVEIRGDLVIDLRDVDYTATSAEGESSFRTGRYTLYDAVAARAVRDEYQTLTLTDAVLRIDVGQPVDLYSHRGDLSIAGQVLVDGTATGLIDEGRATLGLVPEGGFVHASRSDSLAATSAAPSAIPPFALPLALVLALALALALALVARRARPDDVESALVAMSERRWRDALPRLERALRGRPDDASLLLDHAICLEMLGRLPRAARAYEATLRRTPRSAEAHFFLARTLAKLQQSEPGMVHLQTALELDPRLVEMARAESAFRTLGVAR